MDAYKRLTDQIELKGLGWYTLYFLLEKYGWRLFIRDPTPQGEFRNNWFLENNKKAVEQALIEIDYLI